MLGLRRRLAERGVLGINRRNADYVRVLNPRRLYPLVDDKLRTKALALEAGVAVPELYGVIASQHEVVRVLPQVLEGREQFVVKPAHGAGGDGIVVITGRRGKLFRKASGLLMSRDELDHHLSSMLSGLFSLGGQRDRVMIEYCVQFDPLFEQVAFQGVPDIRIIVFHGYPVMAMVRLPTRASDGKANLHQGAVGAGIDLATGRTLTGVSGTELVDEHPDTGHPIAGLQIPGWETILAIAARSYEMTGLGYLGADLVLDRTRGPLMLELNARPGLAIQIANRQGLWKRLQVVEAERAPDAPAEERVVFSRERFRHDGEVRSSSDLDASAMQA
ncbi:MAG: alpha-L-glutamate ligase-like protein [Thermoanaerobaculia bacterium]